jgi:hypothetical protein
MTEMQFMTEMCFWNDVLPRATRTSTGEFAFAPPVLDSTWASACECSSILASDLIIFPAQAIVGKQLPAKQRFPRMEAASLSLLLTILGWSSKVRVIVIVYLDVCHL